MEKGNLKYDVCVK